MDAGGWCRWSSSVLLGLALCSCNARPPSASTSTDPRDLFSAFVQAWNNHDYGALDSLIADHAVEEDLALGFRGEGPDGFTGFMRQTLATIPDFQWTPTNVLADSFKVAAEWTLRGTFTGDTPTGPVKSRRFDIRGVSVVITNGRRITRFSDYYNLSEFYHQVSGKAP
jgi:steroid delta-isomerase-like uncharacterized protein